MPKKFLISVAVCLGVLLSLSALARAEDIYLPLVGKSASFSTIPPTGTPTATPTATPTSTTTPTATATTVATPGWPALQLIKVAENFDQPVHMTHAGDGSNRLFVVERTGYIHILQDGKRLSPPFLDIHSRVACCESETGLLSVAFPPNFANDHFYVTYTAEEEGQLRSRIVRFQVSSEPNRADENSEQLILSVDQPYPNHNGGQILFGPDGYLYIGMGDGGSGGDPHNHGQRPETLLGSMLRFDVESDPSGTYSVPATNPFVQNSAVRPETWAYGLRNPWRFSFDRQTGDLWIADVGQNAREEIDFQPASSKGGENYGWNIMEGKRCYNASTCNQSGLTLPVWDYGHNEGRSVTGGFVYRGSQHPSMQGLYVYGDFVTGKIWGLRAVDEGWENRSLLASGKNISSFGEDEAGELYLVGYTDGTIYRIAPAAP